MPDKRPALKDIPIDKQIIADCKKIGMTEVEIKRAVIADKVMKAWIAEDGVIWNKLLK